MTPKIAFGIATSALLLAAGIFITLRNGGNDKERADAYLKLGQLDSAQSLLERHILKNPRDIPARLVYSQIALERGDTTRAVRVLESIRLDATDSIQRTSVLSTLTSLIAGQGRRADSISKEMLRHGRYDSAASQAAIAAASYRRGRAYEREAGDTFNFAERVAAFRLADVSTRWVTARYLAGASGSPFDLMFESPVSFTDSIAWRLTVSMVATTLDSVANSAFSAKRWNDAKRYYLVAKGFHGIRRDSSEQARSLYNAAMAVWNNGGHVEARQLLRNLRDSFPSYDAANVQRQIVKSAEASSRSELLRIDSRAREQFIQKKWVQARESFREALKVLRTRDMELPEVEAELMYNIAMTYYNESDYVGSRQQLEELQRVFPHYHPELVADMLRKMRD